MERLIRSLRRKSIDHLIIWDEFHLHRILQNYLTPYHRYRTPLSLNKDAPAGRVQKSAELGMIQALPVVGDLYPRYTRPAAWLTMMSH